MRQFKFIPSYYEWHLVDSDTHVILHVMNDVSEDMFYEDDILIGPEELRYFIKTELEHADESYEHDERYNGILLTDAQRLNREEIDRATEVIYNALYDYYLKPVDVE